MTLSVQKENIIVLLSESFGLKTGAECDEEMQTLKLSTALIVRFDELVHTMFRCVM